MEKYHYIVLTKDGKKNPIEKLDYNKRIAITKKFEYGKEWIIPFENIQFITRQDEEGYQKMLKKLSRRNKE